MLACQARDLGARGASHREALDILGDGHDLVDGDTTAVAGLGTVGASHRSEQCGWRCRGVVPDVELRELVRVVLVRLLAPIAEAAGQSLGDNAIEGGADEEAGAEAGGPKVSGGGCPLPVAGGGFL